MVAKERRLPYQPGHGRTRVYLHQYPRKSCFMMGGFQRDSTVALYLTSNPFNISILCNETTVRAWAALIRQIRWTPYIAWSSVFMACQLQRLPHTLFLSDINGCASIPPCLLLFKPIPSLLSCGQSLLPSPPFVLLIVFDLRPPWPGYLLLLISILSCCSWPSLNFLLVFDQERSQDAGCCDFWAKWGEGVWC